MPQRKKLPLQRPSVPKDVPKEDLPAIAPIKVQAWPTIALNASSMRSWLVVCLLPLLSHAPGRLSFAGVDFKNQLSVQSCSCLFWWRTSKDPFPILTSHLHDLQEESKVATKPKPRSRKLRADAAAARQAVIAAPGRQAFYHARGHMPMQDEEVKTLLADPWALPDSDDEEDLSEWKVSPAAIMHPIWPTEPRPPGPPPPPVSVSSILFSPSLNLEG